MSKKIKSDNAQGKSIYQDHLSNAGLKEPSPSAKLGDPTLWNGHCHCVQLIDDSPIITNMNSVNEGLKWALAATLLPRGGEAGFAYLPRRSDWHERWGRKRENAPRMDFRNCGQTWVSTLSPQQRHYPAVFASTSPCWELMAPLNLVYTLLVCTFSL